MASVKTTSRLGTDKENVNSKLGVASVDGNSSLTKVKQRMAMTAVEKKCSKSPSSITTDIDIPAYVCQVPRQDPAPTYLSGLMADLSLSGLQMEEPSDNINHVTMSRRRLFQLATLKLCVCTQLLLQCCSVCLHV